MIITFPNGQQVKVEFDEIAHTYVVAHKLANDWSDWRPTHGITTPLEVVPKPFLVPWGAKLGTEALLEELRDKPLSPEQIEQFFVDKKARDEDERTADGKPVMSSYRFNKQYPWFARAKTAYKRKSGEGKELGTWIHKSIEDYLGSDRKTEPVITEFTQGMWDSFIAFDNFFKPKADEDGLEFLVYSLNFGYSGQGDFRGTMSNKYCIGDWKSTNRGRQNEDGISVEYFFQLGGLAQAEFERTGKWVEDLFAANFDKKGGEPRIIWASDFGMSPQDCAKAYVSCFNTYHTIKNWDYKFLKR